MCRFPRTGGVPASALPAILFVAWAGLAHADDPKPGASVSPDAGQAPVSRDAEPAQKGGGIEPEYSVGLQVNTAGGSYSPVPLDETIPCEPGSCAGGGDVGARFRLNPTIRVQNLTLTATLDLLLGDFYGDRNEIPAPFRNKDGFVLTNAARVDLRFLNLEYTSPIGVLRMGQMGSTWGLGIVTNDGSGTPTFGEHRSGDVVERLQFITKPFLAASAGEWADNTIVAFGGDLVNHDPNAVLANGDRALQAVGALVYRVDPERMAGLYYAYRYQVDADSTFIRASVLDVYGTWDWSISDLTRAYVAFEGAWILGDTTRVLTEAAQGAVGVNSQGGVARIGLTGASRALAAELEGGYASGDNNLNGSVTTRFQFNPEYKVGLVLFDRVLARWSAASAARATDPSLVGYPPLGAQVLPTSGAVAGAEYLALTLKYHAHFGLGLNVSGLVARSTADLIDPLASLRAGGDNTTLRGLTAQGHHDLGREVDVGIDYNLPRRGDFGFKVSLQYGHLFPGSAFSAQDGTPMAGVNTFFFRASFPGDPPQKD